MAEQIHYRPEQAKRFRPETVDELEKFEGRIAEINALLDQVYESGLMRWLKDFVGAMPEISMIGLDALNTPSGRAGLRNMMVMAKQLGQFDPDRLEAFFKAVHTGMDRAGETARGEYESAYSPPGITGVFKLLRDEELWRTISPVLEGAKAFSAEAERQAKENEHSEER